MAVCPLGRPWSRRFSGAHEVGARQGAFEYLLASGRQDDDPECRAPLPPALPSQGENDDDGQAHHQGGLGTQFHRRQGRRAVGRPRQRVDPRLQTATRTEAEQGVLGD